MAYIKPLCSDPTEERTPTADTLQVGAREHQRTGIPGSDFYTAAIDFQSLDLKVDANGRRNVIKHVVGEAEEDGALPDACNTNKLMPG